MNKVFDIAIVGAGIAANALLEELAAHSRMSIALVYGGKATVLEEKKDSVSTNHHPLDECSDKGFGGTSGTWGGRCVDYNDVDFLDRAYIKAKWPISKKHLVPYYHSACQFLKIGSPIFDSIGRDSLRDKDVSFSMTCNERWSLPIRLEKTRKKIEKLLNVTIVHDFHVAKIDQVEAGYQLHSSDESQKGIFCKQCVVAAGGLGTAKILMDSLSLDEFPALGKYYQGHLSGKISNIIFNKPGEVNYAFQRHENVYTRWRFQPTKKAIVEHKLLNTALWLDNLTVSDSRHGNAVLSFVFLLFSIPCLSTWLAPPSIRKSVLGGGGMSSGHFKNILKSPLDIILFSIPFFFRRYVLQRKVPGFFLFSRQGKYALHFHAEQEPDEKHCLSKNEKGGFDVKYGFTDFDSESALKTHQLLDEFLRAQGLGYLEFYSDDERVLSDMMRSQCVDGIHQVGLTRMSSDQKTGVVDSNLQVFQKRNLFVLSSSVFPTSSQANPTFLLVVMAKRLASHLLKGANEKYVDE